LHAHHTGRPSCIINTDNYALLPNQFTGVILNLKKVAMCYVKYEHDIISKHKVELVGWPSDIKFANPFEIRTVDKI
jgi:hypothetical protein